MTHQFDRFSNYTLCRLFSWPLLRPVSILIHEFGHLIAARLVGCPADTISLGYGPVKQQFLLFGVIVRLRQERWGCHGRTHTHSHHLRGLTNLLVIASGPLLKGAFGAAGLALWFLHGAWFSPIVFWYTGCVGLVWCADSAGNLLAKTFKSDGRRAYLTIKHLRSQSQL